MKFGLMYNTGFLGTDPDQIIAVARHAEQCGFESFYFAEHIALYPGASVGPVTIPASTPVADPLECLAFVAAATMSILLGTGVLLLPYHQPVVLAKRLATLDVLSKGRMRLLSVGVGALPGEAMAGGVDFATRGRRADEAIDVLRLLWDGDENGVSFGGEFFSFTRLCPGSSSSSNPKGNAESRACSNPSRVRSPDSHRMRRSSRSPAWNRLSFVTARSCGSGCRGRRTCQSPGNTTDRS